jgi:signal transduction histidine kinase
MLVGSPQMPGPFSGLSVKFIATIVFVILAVEVIIYLPSAANFRANWLDDRVSVGAVAAHVLDFVPVDSELSQPMTDSLLESAGAVAIVYRAGGRSFLIEATDAPMPKVSVTADMRLRDPVSLISGSLDTIFFGGDRILRVIGDVPGSEGAVIEILIHDGALREDILIYSRNIFLLSLILAVMTAGVIFIFVDRSLIRPIRRLTANMMAYRRAPENADLIVVPSSRRDEIGLVERELAAMEADLFSMLRQRRHLADLGLAVAKINHDLRNTLTSAQLLSDQVATLDDPKVQRLAPRLVTTLDRAIGFAQSVLDYGRESTTPPRPQPVDLHALMEEAALDAGLGGHPTIDWANGVPDGITLSADPDQLARVFVNLIRNAREALEGVVNGEGAAISAELTETEDAITISIIDNGPGLPPRARENLFVAFEGSARAGGTGLGLTIARELTEAHGGDLKYVESGTGARFDVSLPRRRRLL